MSPISLDGSDGAEPTLGDLGAVAQALEVEASLRAGDDADSTAGDDPQSRFSFSRERAGPGKSFNNLVGLLRTATQNDRHQAATDGGKSKRWSWGRMPPWLKRQITFYRIHFTMYLIVITIGTIILYFSPNGNEGQVQFVDCLYVATSALCVTGLISLTMMQLSTFDKVVIMVMFMVGSHIFTSLVPVFVRRYYFKKYLEKEGIYELESLADGRYENNVADVADVPDGSFRDGMRADSQGSASFRDMDGGRSNSDTYINSSLPLGEISLDTSDPMTSPSVVTSASNLAGMTSASSMARRGQRGPEWLASTPEVGAVEDPTVGPNNLSAVPPSGTAAAGTGAATEAGGPARPSTGRSKNRPNTGEMRPSSSKGPAAAAGGTPMEFLGMLEDDAAGRDAANNTWAGETAEMNAKRLKKLLSLAKQQQQEQPGTMHSAGETPFLRTQTNLGQPIRLTSGFLTGFMGNEEDHSMRLVAAALPPGERRFLELRALELLSWLVPLYFFGWILVGFLWIFVSLRVNSYYMDILQQNGTNVVFMAVFQSASALVNSGMTLFDSNLVPFQAYLPFLLINMFLILLGTTMYAPALRFLLIIINKFGSQKMKFTTRYLLDHPRKCYTHLFPPSDTKWLVLTVVIFNSVELFFFLVLDWNSQALDGLSTGVKILDGVFQSISTRNAGFNVVSLGLLSPSMLVLYSAMMLIAMYPVYITRQRSREQREVYDDQDLQIFYEDLEGGVMDKGWVGQGKRLMSKDSAILFMAVFLVCIIQNQELETDPTNYSVFTIFFEVMSAYTNVGLSLGYTCPDTNPSCQGVPYSFSAVWKSGAKVIIIILMFMGRHRGLPDNIDAAIVVPDKSKFRRTFPSQNSYELSVDIPTTLSAPLVDESAAPGRQLSRGVSIVVKFPRSATTR